MAVPQLKSGSAPVSAAVTALSRDALASIFEQSVDCVKLVGLGGDVQYMNPNGLCAMQIDDSAALIGQQWAALWPAESQDRVRDSLRCAAAGETVRFRAFCPTAKGAARWWDVTVSTVFGDHGRHTGYLAVSRDVTESELSREAMEIATAEMKHRLKNTYAMVGSLLWGFARGNDDHEAFARTMNDRLSALSAAQSLFVSDDAPCELDLLVAALVTPFDNPGCPVTISGLPSVSLDRGQADAMALVVGELAVNSAKHGAFAHGGRIEISSALQGRFLTTTWAETSKQPVQAQGREGGQGLNLIERIMRVRRGKIGTIWHTHGLTWAMTFELSE